MTDTIEPGDLIRLRDGTVSVCQAACVCCEVIAKGPGWTRHDGSSVNPVPGAECVVLGTVERCAYQACPSEDLTWSTVTFYRVTREALPSQEELSAGLLIERFDPSPSQPPAPQPGWVATAELRFFENQGGMAGITFPSGWTHYVDPRTIDNLDWQPPPPPPWKPEIGEPAFYKGQNCVVRGIYNDFAFCEDVDGDMYSVPLFELFNPKGGGE